MSVPLHEQIADDLRRQISTGLLPVGAPLPSESRLQQHWRGSRGPVRQALASLRGEGLITGGRGKPPVVRRRQLGQPFDTFLSFSKWVHSLGRTPGQQTVEIARRPASTAIARELAIPARSSVVQLVRRRLIDDEPVMLERTTFTLHVGSVLLSSDLDAGSIYELLRREGLEVGPARHTIDAVLADEVDAEHLQITPGQPLLRERRSAYTAAGEPFEYSDDRYRPERVTFTIDNAPEGRPLLDRTWNLFDDETSSSVDNH